MKNIILVALFLIQQSSFASNKINWPSGIKNECRELYLAYEKNNMSYIVNFDHAAKNLRESCKPYIGRFKDYQDDSLYYSCNALYKAVYDGDLKAIKYFDNHSNKKEQEVCMRHASKQKMTSESDDQFYAFTYVVNRLIGMKLHDQQQILNELFSHYAITYLSIDPRYTKYMLNVGANPLAPTSEGTSPLSWALWVVNDLGSCDTARLIIDKMNPEDFAILYKTSLSYVLAEYGLSKKVTLSTPLIDSVISPLCEKETNIIATKAAEINKKDSVGNTALHYLFMAMLYRGTYSNDVSRLNVLIKRGASLDLPNELGITPNDLRLKLKSNPDKCRDFCDKI